MKKETPNELALRIAAFYAGKPIGVDFQTPEQLQNVLGRTSPGASSIAVQQKFLAALGALASGKRAPSADGAEALATLIHEALHTRDGADAKDASGVGLRDPATGMYSPGDEWQAHQLSYNLVPDALQRFFGVPVSSPAGDAWFRTVQARGYGGTLGGPDAAGTHGWSSPDRRITNW